MARATGTITVTEIPQFRRLVQFLEDMDSLGRVNADEEIQGMVEDCRAMNTTVNIYSLPLRKRPGTER